MIREKVPRDAVTFRKLITFKRDVCLKQQVSKPGFGTLETEDPESTLPIDAITTPASRRPE
jgi:hypothetical protein